MRKIPASEDRLVADAIGDIELEDNVLVVRRIHVTYHLRLAADKRQAAERAHGVHARSCPMARTIGGCVGISTSLEMEDLPGA